MTTDDDALMIVTLASICPMIKIVRGTSRVCWGSKGLCLYLGDDFLVLSTHTEIEMM